MRKSALLRAVFPVLICLATVLWLIWEFLSVSVLLKGALTGLVCIGALLASRACYRRQRPAEVSGENDTYPPEGFTGPVLLVCGDLSAPLFADGPRRTTAQGCYLQVAAPGELSAFADRLLAREPRMAGQLVVMFRFLPDLHEDEGLLHASLKVLRQQMKQLKDISGYTPPVVVAGEFSGPETPWIVVREKTSLICPADEPALMLDEWRRLPQSVVSLPYLSQASNLLQQVVLDELSKPDRLCPPVLPFAVTLRCGAIETVTNGIWPLWLFRHSRLLPPSLVVSYPERWHFADPVLPLLMPYAMPLQGGKAGRRAIVVLLLCALSAIGSSVLNNQSLIRRVSADLQRWYAIPMTHYDPKAQALHALQQDALLLERWQRQGEPQRYGLGLYVGERLWLRVQQAIDSWMPPPTPTKYESKPVSKSVRLDSLSLFDSGKSVLKPGSLKMLVNALVDIKARPGWLIVVTGHTDNTGNPQLNQTLSLKRAEALRAWMLSTSDVSPTCFAVQGFGDTRPLASNDTPEGRALNRRVEISLVPQADACLVPDLSSASPAKGDALTQEMEK